MQLAVAHSTANDQWRGIRSVKAYSENEQKKDTIYYANQHHSHPDLHLLVKLLAQLYNLR